MRRQPAQMPMLAAACASPLHSASCAVDKSINRRAYASVYVRIRPYQNDASALGDLGALSWLAGMPALVCAGLESSTSLNFVGDNRRMRAYALGATGDRSINSCADSRRLRAYTRVYARMEYKPGFTENCHDTNIAVTCDTAGCRYNNLTTCGALRKDKVGIITTLDCQWSYQDQ